MLNVQLIRKKQENYCSRNTSLENITKAFITKLSVVTLGILEQIQTSEFIRNCSFMFNWRRIFYQDNIAQS